MEETISIGTLLKSTREAKNISLEEISQKTKININILKSLELGNLDKLPNKTYVRGFVTNYARAVGLNVDEAKLSLEQSYNGTQLAQKVETQSEKTPEPVQTPKASVNTQKAPSANVNSEQFEDLKDKLIGLVQETFSKKVIISICVIVMIVIGVKSIASFMQQLSSEQDVITTVSNEETPKPILKEKNDNLLEMDATKKLALQETEDSKTSEPVTSKIEKKDSEPIVVDNKPEPKKPEPKVIEKKETPKLNAGELPYRNFYQAPSKIYTVLPQAPENKDENLLPDNIKGSLISGKQNVYVVAQDGDTWLSYKKDNDPIKKFVLRKGRRILIKGDRVLIFLGNMNATRIFLNNSLISAKSKTGVKSLIFPQEVATEYELPLFPSYKGIQYNASEYKARMSEKSVQ